MFVFIDAFTEFFVSRPGRLVFFFCFFFVCCAAVTELYRVSFRAGEGLIGVDQSAASIGRPTAAPSNRFACVGRRYANEP